MPLPSSLAGETRSAGPHFSTMRNGGKNRQRRGLPPPCGIHPAGTGCSCVLLFLALGPVGSHRWPGNSKGTAFFSGRCDFYRQGLPLASSCSQLPVDWLPAVATPHHQSRPGRGNRPAIGLAAMVAWCSGTIGATVKVTGRKRARRTSGPVPQGGYLGGNALSGFWFLLPEQKEPPAGSVPARLARLLQRRAKKCVPNRSTGTGKDT